MAHLLVVGAGAAGLFAAGQAVAEGHRVTLLEHMKKPGQKLAITGKGRCNLCNDCDEETFLRQVRHNPRFLYSAIYGFSPRQTMRFFEETLHLPLKTERGRRVFPQSDRAEDVVAALLEWAGEAELVKARAVRILLEEGVAKGIQLETGPALLADAVLLATGGLSYPVTGSTGLGYEMAKQAGHKIVPPQPSLVALVENESVSKQMQGLSLRNVALTLLENGKPVFSEQGEMIFTHFGISGPLTLSASAYVEDGAKKQYTAEINLKPALTTEQLDARLQRDFAEFAGRNAANCLDKLLPAAMRPVMLSLWGIDPHKKGGQITREERQSLAELVRHFPLAIKGKGDLEHAVVTSGGVDVKEVNPKTMESRLCKNLYFAGEILDVDGYTGGYNLQIAWSTAYAAARAL